MPENHLHPAKTGRKAILRRLLFTVVCLLAFEIIKILVQLTVLVQYLLLLISKSYSEALRSWSNRLAAYGFRLIRYLTLVENTAPFPFAGFPGDLAEPEGEVSFPGGLDGGPDRSPG